MAASAFKGYAFLLYVIYFNGVIIEKRHGFSYDPVSVPKAVKNIESAGWMH